MKTAFSSLRNFYTSLLTTFVLFFCYNNVNAQVKNVSVCEQINNIASNFVKLVDENRAKVENKSLTETDKELLAKEFQRIEQVFNNPNSLPEYHAFNRYLLIRSTVSYYNFLFKIKDYQQISELGKKAFTYPDGVKAEDCICEVKGFKTVQLNKIDEEFGDYTVEKEVQATVAIMKVTPKNLYELSDGLLSIVALAAHRLKNYEQRDQFFSKTFNSGYVDWANDAVPYTLSTTVLQTYVEGSPIKDVEICAAITFLNAHRLRTVEQLKDNSKKDSITWTLAKNIINKSCGDELNPITNLDPVIYIKALITFLAEKSISDTDKANMVSANFSFLTKSTISFSENWTFRLDNIFKAFNQNVTASILNSSNNNFVSEFINYIDKYKATILKENVNGQLVYDVYLYCKAKKDKRAKDLYKWIEYRKDIYPTFVK